jgi:hypothetical protein
MVGLAEMGSPDAEGYFLRWIRETSVTQPPHIAVRALGRIAGKRSFAPLVETLKNPSLFAAACEALSRYGEAEAAAPLLPHADRPEALTALARMGARAAREKFLEALAGEMPLAAEAARGLGRAGNPEDGKALLPHLASPSFEMAAAAFEAYCALGVPEGYEPLRAACAEGVAPWMVAPLARLDDPQAYEILFSGLGEHPAKTLWRKILFWKRPPQAEPREIYAALGNARDPRITIELARSISQRMNRLELRGLLRNPLVHEDAAASAEMVRILRGRDLLAAYFVAESWLRDPSIAFFFEALRTLRLEGFLEMDHASAIDDEARLLETAARESSPSLLLGGFLDSGLLDLDTLHAGLRRRFAEGSFPSDGRPADLDDAGWGNFKPLLDALDLAFPGMKDSMNRLWRVLLDTEDRGAPLYELFWCETGLHRGGIQRLLRRRMEESVSLWTEGKDDGFLREVEKASAQVPTEGPLTAPLGEIFARARAKLMAECKDMVVWTEGGKRGDMVLIARL